MDEEQAVSWRAITAHCPLIANDGSVVGTVLDVAALPREDIFHGVVFRHGEREPAQLAPAEAIDRITDRAVYLKVDGDRAAGFEPFHQQHVERLGLKGHFFWKHLGWEESDE